MIKKCIPLCLGLFCLGASWVHAEETANSRTVYSLGEVVVTAPEELGVEDIGTLHEITAEQIEMRHVKTLDKALELLPGLDVRNGGQGIPRVNLRGLRSRHVVLLLNGIPFNSTYDGQFDPSAIPVENIAKIKVSYGGHSVLYGQGGLGGVINIITKKGDKKFHGSVAADMDERGAYNAQTDLSGGSDRADFFVSASRQDSDGFLLSDDFAPTAQEDGGLRENSDFERENVFANIGLTATDDLKFGLVIGGGKGEYGQPPSTITNSSDPFYKKPKYERVEDYTETYAQVSAGYETDGVFGMRAWAFINQNEQDKARYDDNTYTTITAKGGYQTTDKTTITGTTLQSSLDYKAWGKWSASISAEKEAFDSVGGIVEKNNNPMVAYDISHEIDLYAAALEYNVTILDSLGLVAGISHHWQNKDVGADDDKTSFLVGATYDLGENTRFRTSYARKIRFASIKNLYDTSSGNSDLTTEQADNFEAGVTQNLGWGIEADLAFFLNDVKDYIEKDSTTDIYENNEKYRFKGMELMLTKDFDHAGLSLGYTWLDAEDRSSGSTRDDLEYRPTHKITLEGRYAFDFGLTAYGSLASLMDQVFYADDGTKGELKDFILVDVRLEQDVFRNTCFVCLGADNLLDENYEESYGFPQAGRTAYAGMKFKF